jgi:gliding motility-associated lipoprotein GldH
MKNRNIIFGITLLLGTLLSCDNNRIFEENISVPNKEWMVDYKPTFDFEIQDTTLFYNFYINLRNNTDYPYSNLYLFVNSYLPDGSMATDTLEVYLANREGKWLGKGLGKIKESRFFLKQNLVFPRKGQYSIEIEQAMRTEKLIGIEDIGIRIEQAEL